MVIAEEPLTDNTCCRGSDVPSLASKVHNLRQKKHLSVGTVNVCSGKLNVSRLKIRRNYLIKPN